LHERQNRTAVGSRDRWSNRDTSPHPHHRTNGSAPRTPCRNPGIDTRRSASWLPLRFPAVSISPPRLCSNYLSSFVGHGNGKRVLNPVAGRTQPFEKIQQNHCLRAPPATGAARTSRSFQASVSWCPAPKGCAGAAKATDFDQCFMCLLTSFLQGIFLNLFVDCGG
jgi:hypothetical protein